MTSTRTGLAGPVARRLFEACGQVHEPTPDDHVDGMRPALVAGPASTEETAAVMRVAAGAGLVLTARGRGTKMSWGRPPSRLDLILDVSRMQRVIDHAAGDLVLWVEAGITLSAVRRTLEPSRQRLMLDETVPGSSIGGTIATATSGPRRIQRGTVRDLLIGVTMVRADGAVTKAGGRVVKNVAGYDLGKLMIGSFATLGVITEAIFRLHPQPEAQRFTTVPVEGPEQIARLARVVLESPLAPGAIEIDWRTGEGGDLVVLLEGLDGGVARRATQLLELLGGSTATVADQSPEWWSRYPWSNGDCAVKATFALSGLPRVLTCVEEFTDATSVPVRIRGSAGAGVLYVAFSAHDLDHVIALVEALRSTCSAFGGSAVVVDAPIAVKSAVDSWGPVNALSLMRKVKHEFDPDNRLSPGRFVGGI